jgi:hypothetical protein
VLNIEAGFLAGLSFINDASVWLIDATFMLSADCYSKNLALL